MIENGKQSDLPEDHAVREENENVLSRENWIFLDQDTLYRRHRNDTRNEYFQIPNGLKSMSYCVEGDIIARVDEKGRLFVSGTHTVSEQDLQQLDYTQQWFPVPFSHREIPAGVGLSETERKWQTLLGREQE